MLARSVSTDLEDPCGVLHQDTKMYHPGLPGRYRRVLSSTKLIMCRMNCDDLAGLCISNM